MNHDPEPVAACQRADLSDQRKSAWTSRELLHAVQQDKKIELQDSSGCWIEQCNMTLLAAALYSNPFAVGRFRVDGMQRAERTKSRSAQRTGKAQQSQAPTLWRP